MESAAPAVDTARDQGVDNVRSLLVAGMVLMHAGCAYASFLGWWYVRERASSLLVDVSMATASLLLMTPLFFFAGYLMLPSIERRGVGGYWRERLRRLGLPWAFCTLLVSPVLMFVWCLQREAFHGDYATYLRAFFGGYRLLFVGVLEHYDTIERHHLWWHQLWFIPDLLLLTLVAQGYALRAGWLSFPRSRAVPRASTQPASRMHSAAAIVLCLAAVSLLAFFAASAWLPDYAGRTLVLSSLLTIHPTRFSIYTAVFVAGMLLARSGHRLAALPAVGTRRIYALLALSIVFYLVGLASVRDGRATMASPAHWLEGVGVVVASWTAVLAAVRLSLDLKRRVPWLAWLTPYSLGVYFTHYGLCVAIHLALQPLALAPLAKWAVSFVVVLPASVALARRPRLTLAAVLALQAALLVWY